MSGNWAPRRRGRATIPNARLPKLPGIKRNPAGYGTTEIALRTRGLPQAARLGRLEPAGDPPSDWDGTRPEWAVHWALEKLGYEEGIDYMFRFNIAGLGSSYYSQFDFVIFDFFIAIEVQGEFWHYGQGHEKMAKDELRRVLAATHGFTLIFVDENDVLERPEFLVEEALAGVDHSKSGSGKRG